MLQFNPGSQVLLSNAERLGVLLARTQSSNETQTPLTLSRANIGRQENNKCKCHKRGKKTNKKKPHLPVFYLL